MVRTSVIHSVAPGATFLFLTHFDAVCDLSRECSLYSLGCNNEEAHGDMKSIC